MTVVKKGMTTARVFQQTVSSIEDNIWYNLAWSAVLVWGLHVAARVRRQNVHEVWFRIVCLLIILLFH